MTSYRLAIPASLVLLASILPPGIRSASNDNDANTSSPPLQAVSQVAPTTTAPTPLTDEELADLFMIRKEFRAAEQKYKELIHKDPRNAVYMNKLGIAMHQQSDLGAALKCYKKAVKLNPQYADAQNNIGTIWYQRKKYGKAIRAYKKAIKMRSDMAVLYSNLGYAYFGKKKYEESIASFRQALMIDPQVFEHGTSRAGSLLQDRSVYDRGQFFFLLAKSFAEAGNYERSIFYLRKAKDEGYKSLNKVKSDPAFAAMMKLRAIQPAMEEVLAPPSYPLNQ